MRQAEAGTYAARPRYASHDEVGASLDLIDRLVNEAAQECRRSGAGAAFGDRRAHPRPRSETPLNALAIHLEVLRTKAAGDDGGGDQSQRSIAALDSSIRQVDRLVRDFTDYSAPVTMERKRSMSPKFSDELGSRRFSVHG